MNITIDPQIRARQRGLFLFLAALLVLLPGQGMAQDQNAAPAAGPGSTAAALRTPPPELPPTQASVIREKMRVQIRGEGENKFRYAREMHADGYLVRARQLLQDFLILFPDHDRRFAALEMLARIEAEQDQPRRAIAAYRRAYAAVPGEDRGLEAGLQAARLLAGMGQIDEARTLLLEIRGRKPDSRLARLVEIELQALGLPLLYDRSQPVEKNPDGNHTTETENGLRPDPPDAQGGADGPGPGPGDSGNAGRESSRGLLDGTAGVPTDDDRSIDSGDTRERGAGESGQNSADTVRNSAPGGAEGSPSGADTGAAARKSDEALQLMGEGVERPRNSRQNRK